MGEVVAVIKLMPREGIDFEAMKKAVENAVDKYESIEEEPIAFGLKALKLTIVVKDEAGGTEGIEKKLGAVPEVGDVQVIDLARL